MRKFGSLVYELAQASQSSDATGPSTISIMAGGASLGIRRGKHEKMLILSNNCDLNTKFAVNFTLHQNKIPSKYSLVSLVSAG